MSMVRKPVGYDPETGKFYREGKEIGYLRSDGYLDVSFAGEKHVLAHRLAWLFMTGEWPDNFVDHINRNRDDNRWGNLRQANNSQNKANAGLLKSNTSGHRGVGWSRAAGKWRAYVQVNGEYRHLGCFSTTEEAAQASAVARQEAFGEFAA